MRIANVQDGDISLKKPKFVQLTKQTERFELEEGDILTSLTGNVGRVAEIKASHLPAALNQRVARIKPKEDVDVDRSYLRHFLSSDAFSSFLEQEAHGAAQANVSPNAIKEVPFALPPLAEQKRIVSILDEAFEGLDRARENAEANLKNARELFDATLQFTLDPKGKKGWGIKLLGDVCEFRGGGTPSKQNADFWGGDIPWVSPKDMKFDVVTDSIDRVTEEAVENSAAKHIPEGAILVVVRSGILARTIPTAIAGRGLTINQDIKAILPNKSLDQKFTAYFFRSAEQYLLDQVKRGATVHKLDMPVLKSLPIPLPPLAEQKSIVFELDKISIEYNSLKVHYQTKLQDITDLRQSLLQKAFTGELT